MVFVLGMLLRESGSEGNGHFRTLPLMSLNLSPGANVYRPHTISREEIGLAKRLMFDANKNINVLDASIQGDQCDYLSVVFP